ncbi:retrovirus-related pol polyprotein from transposon TNT 1-94 [Tanacetum coccineum]
MNGKKYILVIVDDYSRFTWVMFLRSKDETLEFVIKFLKQIQVGLNKTVRYIRTDNGTEFVNQVLTQYYKSVSIFHQKSVSRTPQQNGVVERRNRTLVEAARTMLIFSKALMFLWAEAIATAALCYPTNDNEDLGKLHPTVDIGIFVGYAPSRKGYRIYNKRTRQIMETIHVSYPIRFLQQLMYPPTNKELEILFQLMFDEYLEPPRIERPVSPTPAVPVPVNSVALQSPSSQQGVAAGFTIIEDNPFVPIENDPFINVFAPEPSSEASSFGDVSSAESTHVT